MERANALTETILRKAGGVTPSITLDNNHGDFQLWIGSSVVGYGTSPEQAKANAADFLKEALTLLRETPPPSTRSDRRQMSREQIAKRCREVAGGNGCVNGYIDGICAHADIARSEWCEYCLLGEAALHLEREEGTVPATAWSEETPPPSTGQWRSIESAPKDGTWVMGIQPVKTRSRKAQPWSVPTAMIWEHGKWCLGCDCDICDPDFNYPAPTHWMPLPLPPDPSGERPADQDKDHGGTSLTEGARVSGLVPTPQLTHDDQFPGCTEIRPGVYVRNDGDKEK